VDFLENVYKSSQQLACRSSGIQRRDTISRYASTNRLKGMASKKTWTLDDVAKTFRACESLFHALGDPARQQIVLLLAEHERLNVNQITELMHLSRPSISHHLKVLKDAGMVSLARESRENFYSLLWDEPIGRLKLLIKQSEVACG
jgi:ArsR family transcriptional regulator